MKSTKLISALLATIGALSLSVSMTIAKQLDPNIPTTMIVFVKSSFGLLFFIPVLIKENHFLSKTTNLPMHVLRIVIGICAMLCTYYAYRNLPIALATSIGMTSPIFITALSALLLKEIIGYKKWVLIILGYIGVLIIIKPTDFILNVAIISALLANLLAAMCTIIIKKLSKQDSLITIMLYGNIGIFVASFMASLTQWYSLTLNEIGSLSLMGALGLITQVCSINSLKLTTPSFIAPFEYSRLLFAILIGFFIFHEIPERSTLVGVSIVIVSTYIMILLGTPSGGKSARS